MIHIGRTVHLEITTGATLKESWLEELATKKDHLIKQNVNL